jgi:hypothetical protein
MSVNRTSTPSVTSRSDRALRRRQGHGLSHPGRDSPEVSRQNSMALKMFARPWRYRRRKNSAASACSKPALHGDEGRIVERSVLETKELGEVGPLCHSQRKPGKRRHCGGDADVRAERSAAMDVRGRIGRGQAEKSCDDLYCFSRRIKYYDCGARSGRIVGRPLICTRKDTSKGHRYCMGGWCGSIRGRQAINLKAAKALGVEGDYLEIVKWQKHQKIDRPSPSKIPRR